MNDLKTIAAIKHEIRVHKATALLISKVFERHIYLTFTDAPKSKSIEELIPNTQIFVLESLPNDLNILFMETKHAY